jgi:hypothetical protein
MSEDPMDTVWMQLYKQERTKNICMQGASPDGVHTACFDCLHGGRPPTHPLHIACCMQSQGLYMVHRITQQRVCLSRGPPTVICKDKV